MKHTTLKRLLAFVLAAVMLLSLTACFDDSSSTKETNPPSSSPTNPAPTDPSKPAPTDPSKPAPTDPSKPAPTDPSDPGTPDPSEPETPDDGMITVYASVPSDWTAPYFWAWAGSQNAFDAWPGEAMTKSGNWYKIEVPNWVEGVIVSNNGKPQTDDLSVTKGKDLWIVVKSATDATVYYSEPGASEPETPDTPDVPSSSGLQHDALKYVVIYNPYVFDPNQMWDTSSRNTGYLGTQIDVNVHRGSGLEEEYPWQPYSQGQITEGIEFPEVSGGRGDGLGHDYEVGDTKQFYCSTAGVSDANIRSLRTMTCVYAGKYCYVWNDGSMAESQLKMYGEEFDRNIYEDMIETFGKPRFVGDSGKVNLMFYNLPNGLGGYFHPLDLYASDEVSAYEVAKYGVNTDHAMVHINALYASIPGYTTSMNGTLAHEFQHLLCQTAVMSSGVQCGLWLNEAMSGYIEEQLYPGGKLDSGHLTSYNTNTGIRGGRSLYHFANELGDYGSVYYFTEYLAKFGGEDVFANIHDYWKNSYSDTLCDAEAIYNSVDKEFRSYIDSYVEFASSVKFNSKEEEWMSKLTLNFYMTMFSKEGNLPNYNYINNAYLLYDDMEGASIEGGGRIILATSGNSFEIPDDAGSGLVYIGLDKDYNIVTYSIPE